MIGSRSIVAPARHFLDCTVHSSSQTPDAMTNDNHLTPEETLAIDCQGLTYAFSEGLESALDGVDLKLKKGDRCLLVGANGGKLVICYGYGVVCPLGSDRLLRFPSIIHCIGDAGTC